MATDFHAFRDRNTGEVAMLPASIARTFPQLELVDESEVGCTTCGPTEPVDTSDAQGEKPEEEN